MILKQSQGHETQNENVDHEQGHNHAKFERCHSNSNNVQEKGNIKVFLFVCLFGVFLFFSENIPVISPEHMQKSKKWYIDDLLYVINNQAKFQLNWIRT